MSDVPPLYMESTSLGCHKREAKDAPPCGALAQYHIFWTPDMEDSLACEDHALEAIEVWKPWRIHKISPPCMTPSPPARFLSHENICILPGKFDPVSQQAIAEHLMYGSNR